jgi:hypothetical protein
VIKLFSLKFELVVFCAMRKDWTKGIYHLGALTEHTNLKVFGPWPVVRQQNVYLKGRNVD